MTVAKHKGVDDEMAKMTANGEPFSTVENKTFETFVPALKSVHVVEVVRAFMETLVYKNCYRHTNHSYLPN